MTGRLVGFVNQFPRNSAAGEGALRFLLTSPPYKKITSSTHGINMAKAKEKFAITISPIDMSKDILQLVLILIFGTVLIIVVLHGKQLFSIKMKNT